jgi:hypothetical protein
LGRVAEVNKKRITYKFGIGKSEGKGTLARTKSRSYDNIKVDVRVVGLQAVWINGDQNMKQLWAVI